MATKKFLSLERLTEYDALIKAEIAEGDASVKSYVDTEVAKKANSSHTHDDRYYTETEIDLKLSAKSDVTHNHDSDYDEKGTASSVVSTHNTNAESHNDIRSLITDLTTRLNTLANSTDIELDQMAELVNYIKENRDLIEGVTTNKVNVSDIVDNLTTNVSNKPLSAAQGVEIKNLINALQEAVDIKVSSVSLVSGTNNGTVKLTVNGISTDNIAVKGLGSAAYTESSAYATSNHNHDDVYSKTNHNHNNDYYTKVENDNLLAGKSDKTHTHGISDITDLQDSLNNKANQTSLDGHDNNTTKHITSTERTNWNAAKTHADSDHDKYINQNAFSNVKVGSTTIAADSNTDTLELVGSNVTITPDATNDKVTIAVADGTTNAKGLVQLTDSTSSTSTATAATPNSVKSAYDLANQAKTAATNAQTTADGKADVNHIQSIDKGGTGYTSITDTTYTTARYRASSLHSTETNPSVNGVIAWTYE